MTMPRPPTSDRDVQREVVDALNRDGRLLPAEIGVTVRDGIVTLSGTVSSYDKAAIAADVAVSVGDVRDVANTVMVEGDGDRRDDPRIARFVTRGLVTLVGEIGSGWLRHQAETVAASAPGVHDVDNKLRTRS